LLNYEINKNRIQGYFQHIVNINQNYLLELSFMVFIACDLVELQQHVNLVFLIDLSSAMVDGDPKTPKTVM
jgi:hypothetical protein